MYNEPRLDQYKWYFPDITGKKWKGNPQWIYIFFKLRHSHKGNFQITTTQIPLKKQRKNQIPLWWVHEPSLRVHMKRGGGYMGFAVGVYETGLYVENVHPNKWIRNEFLQSENETNKRIFDKHQPIKIIHFFDFGHARSFVLCSLFLLRKVSS